MKLIRFVQFCSNHTHLQIQAYVANVNSIGDGGARQLLITNQRTDRTPAGQSERLPLWLKPRFDAVWLAGAYPHSNAAHIRD